LAEENQISILLHSFVLVSVFLIQFHRNPTNVSDENETHQRAKRQ